MPGVTHLRALQALELAIRKGSLKAAAAELSITPAALGQRIRSLEDYLGFDLLVRGRSGIRPTKELDAAVAHLSAGFRELETVTHILDFQRVHEIHVSADSDWAELWLKPRLPSFKKSNPNTLFCINGTGDVPVRLGDYDCEVFFGDEPANDARETLFHDYLLPVSSAEVMQRVYAQTAANLEGLPLLHLDCYTSGAGAFGWPEWVARYGYRDTGAGIGIRYQRVTHALEAVYANSGLIVCGLALIKPVVDEGQLEIPFPIEKGQWCKSAYQVSFRHGALRREQTERFRTWLLDQADATKRELQELIDSAAT